MAPGTGVFLNNFLFWTDLDPESPNYLQGGQPIELMLAPTQGFREGTCVLSIGTPGSFGILQTTPQMILNHVEFGMNIQEAIEAPRVRVYRDRLLDAEARIPETAREGLAARGHRVNVLDEDGGWIWVTGGAHGIVRDLESGALVGGADPRRDGCAMGHLASAGLPCVAGDPLQSHPWMWRSRGSRYCLSQSPMRFTDSTVTIRASPGNGRSTTRPGYTPGCRLA